MWYDCQRANYISARNKNIVDVGDIKPTFSLQQYTTPIPYTYSQVLHIIHLN